MKIKKVLSLVVFSGLICACSPKQPEQQPTNLPQKKSQGVLTDSQQKILEKAKQTEELLDKTAKERMKQVDDATDEK